MYPAPQKRPGLPRLGALAMVALLCAGCVATVSGKPKVPANEAVALFMRSCVETARSGQGFKAAFAANDLVANAKGTAEHSAFDLYGIADNTRDPATGAPYAVCGVMGSTDTPAAIEVALLDQITRRLGPDAAAGTPSRGPVTTYAVSIGGRPAQIAINRQKAIGNFALFLKVSTR